MPVLPPRSTSLLVTTSLVVCASLAVITGMAGLAGCDYGVGRDEASESSAVLEPDANAPLADAASEAGVPDAAAVFDAAVDATSPPAPVAVTAVVNGLSGTGLVLQLNGGTFLPIFGNGSFPFPATLAPGASYIATVSQQPVSPGQTCTLTGGSGTAGDLDVQILVTCTSASFAIGGTVSGLAAGPVVLQNELGDTLTVSRNGPFTFATPVASGSPFKVTILAQPAAPAQTCSVSGAFGTVGSGDVSSVVVDCSANTFTVGGTVSGLGSSAVLAINGGETATVSSNGAFAFPTPLVSGTAFTVVVQAQPTAPTQTCDVYGGSGMVTSANVTAVTVVCMTRTFTVGGTVTGLNGGALVLRNDGGDELTLTGNGPFVFALPVASGASYSVDVALQPSAPSQTCVVDPMTATGVVGASAVTSVSVSCTANLFAVGGVVTGLAGGSSVVLSNPGSQDVTVNGNVPFQFAAVPSGASFSVAVETQPSAPVQTCVVTGGSGTVRNANALSVVVNCADDTYTVGGSASGLTGPLVLQNKGGEAVTVTSAGSFAFPTPLASGSPYAVTVFSAPAGQTCAVAQPSGTIGSSNVTNVQVTCQSPLYPVGGTLSGLASGVTLTLTDGLDTISLTASGPFAFPTQLPDGSSYGTGLVSISGAPQQRCVLSNSSGLVGPGSGTSVVATCTTSTFAVGGTVSGLSSLGLVLANTNGDHLAVGADGSFAFPTPVASGASYDVTVSAQPTSPAQTCVVGGASGVVGTGNVSGVTVNCTPDTYALGGKVTGLLGTLVLANGGETATVTSSSFSFPTPLASGDVYDVTVANNPTSPPQTCTVAKPEGAVGNAPVTLAVTCTTNAYRIMGSVGGLVGSGLVLLDNGGDPLAIKANGAFTFATPVNDQQAYAVTVQTQPNGRNAICMISQGTGTVQGADVMNVVVTCAAYATTCNTLLAALPGTPDGVYTLDPDGDNDAIAPFAAQCDMTWQSGGWTLIYSTNGAGPEYASEGLVTYNSQTYMPVATMEVVAGLSTQVHLRTDGDPADQSITSVPNAIPLQDLVQGRYMGWGMNDNDATTQLAQWTGPFATNDHIVFGCGNYSSLYFPVLWWGCGTNAMHILGSASRWNWNGGDDSTNVPLDLFVR